MSQQKMSPIGWYIVTLIERFEHSDEDKSNLDRRCIVWENLILVEAESPETAYDKAMSFGNQRDNKNIIEYHGDKGKWIFEGISDLVPIYEKIGDLSEVLWIEHENVTVRDVRASIYSKDELLSLY